MIVLAFALGVILGVVITVVLLRARRGSESELIGRFEQEMRSLEGERKTLNAALTKHMELLGEETGRIATQSQDLATALRRPGIRGHWGEMTLKNVVENCGLAEHCDFETQVHLAGEDGAVRPDMVVKLPGGGRIPVDAKVPLDAYWDAIESEDEERTEQFLDQHIRQVRSKVSELASKAYWKRFTRSPQTVVMFVANEAAVSVACQRDSSLLSDAAKSQVMIATPTTMTALLQVVAVGWREEKIAEHAGQVGRLAQELCERLENFVGHLANTSKGLDSAVRAHNQAIGSFEGRLSPTVRRIGELGVEEAKGAEAPRHANQLVRHPAPTEESDAPAELDEGAT
jgi:DNA recombination protein RmuC